MPRFFFHVHDGASFIDREGTDLVDWREAQQEAIRLAGQIIGDNAKRMKLGEDWLLEVTNESGLVLFRLDFHISASPVIMGTEWKKEDPP